MTLYRSKFDGVSVFGNLEDVVPREDVEVGTPMMYLGEEHQSGAGEDWRYLKVILPSGFIGWILRVNTEEMA
jgi:hypothetical protein